MKRYIDLPLSQVSVKINNALAGEVPIYCTCAISMAAVGAPLLEVSAAASCLPSLDNSA
jgi:hypothetical protein